MTLLILFFFTKKSDKIFIAWLKLRSKVDSKLIKSEVEQTNEHNLIIF